MILGKWRRWLVGGGLLRGLDERWAETGFGDG